MTDVPEGYRPLAVVRGFIDHVGPVYGRIVDETISLGFRVEDHQVNPAGICHGGMLMTIADMQLALGSFSATGVWEFLPTVNMTCDFVAPARASDWVAGKFEVVRTTRNLVFGSVILFVDESPILRASGILKRNPEIDRKVDLERLLKPA